MQSGPIPHCKTTRTASESNGQCPHRRMGQRPMVVVRGNARGCLHGKKPSKQSQSDQRAYRKVHGRNRGSGKRGWLPQWDCGGGWFGWNASLRRGWSHSRARCCHWQGRRWRGGRAQAFGWGGHQRGGSMHQGWPHATSGIGIDWALLGQYGFGSRSARNCMSMRHLRTTGGEARCYPTAGWRLITTWGKISSKRYRLWGSCGRDPRSARLDRMRGWWCLNSDQSQKAIPPPPNGMPHRCANIAQKFSVLFRTTTLFPKWNILREGLFIDWAGPTGLTWKAWAGSV